jgi:MFS family permease
MDTLSARGYWPTVTLILLAICPGLIVATASDVDGVAVAGSLGTSPTDVSWASVWGVAALALGAVLAAALSDRLGVRTLYTGGLGLVLVGAVVAAISPNLQLLVVARSVQGVGTGILLVAAISTLLTAFPPDRLPLSIAILSCAVAGALVAGPVIGGIAAQEDTWRWLFAVVAGLSTAALPLTFLLPEPAPMQHRRYDLWTLGLAIIGIGLLFYGLGGLGWHDWDAASIWAPVTAGLVALFAPIVTSAMRRDAVLPIRMLGRPIVLLGTVSAVTAMAVFVSMLGVLPPFLEIVRGLGLRDVGVAFWPGIAGALIAAVVAGFVVPSRSAPVLPFLGLACLALAGWSLTWLSVDTGDTAIGQLAGLLGLGAGLVVVPGLLLAALRVPRAFVARLAGLILLLVFCGAGLAQAATLRGLATSVTGHYLALAAESQGGASGGVQSTDLTQTYLPWQLQPGSAGSDSSLLQQALVWGLNDTGTVILVLSLLGLAVGAIIIIAGRFLPARSSRGVIVHDGGPDVSEVVV